MSLKNIFRGKHSDYYAKKTFLNSGSSYDSSNVVEVIRNLVNRIEKLEKEVSDLKKALKINPAPSIKKSELDDIKGLGEQKKIDLLIAFGNIDNIKRASIIQLQSIPGIGKKIAHNIKSSLK